jgi:hypothetical protein
MTFLTYNRTTCLAILCLIFPLSLWAKEPVLNNTQTQHAPFRFIENKGQIVDQFGKHRNDIQFRISSGGVNVFAGAGALHYQWTKALNGDTKMDDGNGRPIHPSKVDFDIYRMDVSLVGADPNAAVIVEDKQDFFENYFLAQCPGGVTAHAYSKVTYKNVYPNIDWVLYVSAEKEGGERLKYDFIVHPGGNAADIKLNYGGTTELKIKHGALVASTPFGSITEQKPVCFEKETNKPLEAAYVLNGSELSFNVAEHNGTLVIDPAIDWCTYYGGAAWYTPPLPAPQTPILGVEYGYTIVTDTASSVYLGGSTNSDANIATSSSYQTSLSGTSTDGFVVKFDKSGARQWATYYGGAGYDDFFSSTIDTNGNIYFAGITTSSGLATAGTHQPSYGGNGDAYLVKFNPTTGARIWATYYGGPGAEQSGVDYQVWVACDSKNNLFLCGNTISTTGIATAGAFQTTLNPSGRTDGFLAKFNTSAVRQWGTYVGDWGNDRLRKIVIDPSGNVYAAGDADSTPITGGLGTSGTDKPTFTNPSGTVTDRDAFILKFNQSGVRQWGTYYGGSGDEALEGFIADANGYIYIAGSTTSANTNNCIATPGSFQTSNAGLNDGFLAKFDGSGQRIWSTYFGSNGVEHGGDMTIDAFGNICFTGSTGQATTNTLATTGAYQTANAGGFDGFLAIFTIDGFRYYASYFGGSQTDFTYGLKYTSKGDLYLAGFTQSSSGISTSGSYQATYSGTQDAFLARFKADTSAFIIQPLTFTTACAGDSISVPFGITSTFRSANVFTLQLSNSSGSFASPVNIGTLTSINGGTLKGFIPISTPLGNGYRIRIISSSPSSTSFDNGTDIPIRALPAKPTSSSNSPVCTAEGPLTLNANTSTSGVTWSWTGPQSFTASTQNTTVSSLTVSKSGAYIVTATLNGCSQRDTVNAVINQSPVKPTVGGNTPVCNGSTLNLTATTSTSGVTWHWTGPNSFTSNLQNPGRPNIGQFDGGYYVAIDTLGTCTAKDSVLIVVNYIEKPVATTNAPLCSSTSNLLLFASTSTTGVTYSWTGPSYSSGTQNPSISSPTIANAGNYVVTVTKNGCNQKDTVAVVINATPAKPTVGGNTPVCSGNTLNLTASSTTPGVTWGWTGPAGFTSSTQNPSVAGIAANGSGYYVAVDTQGGCIAMDSVFIVVNPTHTPSVAIGTQNGVTAICIGDSILFTAYGSNGGPSPAYQWRKNGIALPGKTAATYMAKGLLNNDQISCVYYGSGPCLTKPADTSAPVTINVLSMIVPKVGIDAAPGMKLGPFTQVVLTAVDTFGGIAPLYQWYKNGTAIPGAISKIFIILPGVDAAANDQYCVMMTSTAPCVNPDTASHCTDPLIIDLAVKNAVNSDMAALYPNPNTGNFTIITKMQAETEVSIEIMNAVGQVVQREKAPVKQGMLHEQVTVNKDLPDGMYIIRIRGEKEQKLMRFILDK